MSVRTAGKLRYVFAKDIKLRIDEPGLIDGVLELKGMTIVYGPSGGGKTAVVVDLACRIAAGMPWRTCPAKQGVVIYIAAENADSTGKRVWAWMQRHGVLEIPLVLVQSPITMDGEGVKALRVLVQQVEAEAGEKVRLIVLDTLARTFAGDENQAKDMGEYVKALDQVKADIDGHVLVVHHTGKDESRGGRGSSALKAATDHEIEVTKPWESRIGTITLTKLREGDLQGQRFGYELRSYMLGHNALNREVTTPVIEECTAPAKEKATMGNTDEARIRAVIEAADGRLTEKELKAKIRLREGDSTNRGAWRRAKERGSYEVDEYGYVS